MLRVKTNKNLLTFTDTLVTDGVFKKSNIALHKQINIISMNFFPVHYHYGHIATNVRWPSVSLATVWNKLMYQ